MMQGGEDEEKERKAKEGERRLGREHRRNNCRGRK